MLSIAYAPYRRQEDKSTYIILIQKVGTILHNQHTFLIHIHKEYVVVTNNCLKQVHAEKCKCSYVYHLQSVVSNGETISLVLVKGHVNIGIVQ